MITHKSMLTIGIVALLFLMATTVKADIEDTIVGTISSSGETITIITPEGAYMISPDGKGSGLSSLVGKVVKVTGNVEEDENGNKTITVLEYEEVVEEPAAIEEQSPAAEEGDDL